MKEGWGERASFTHFIALNHV